MQNANKIQPQFDQEKGPLARLQLSLRAATIELASLLFGSDPALKPIRISQRRSQRQSRSLPR